jgi:hypothetical protein
VLHGQIPADDLAEFSGPTSYATGCAANYFFWREGIDTDFVFTDSVRHFTADGAMTEVCNYTPVTGAQVIHYDEVPCTVSWSDSNPSFASDCSGKNTKTPNGGYTLVLHGQIPADDLAEFSGPTSYATGCAANYFFWREGIGSR